MLPYARHRRRRLRALRKSFRAGPNHRAAPLVARVVEPANRPTAAEFAAAWLAQCAAPGAAAQGANLAEVVLAASEFLRYLDAALQPYHAS